ncbi:MAG: hypothetical protein KY428_00820, partial [Bacteroidetes bacterium]|nr:hypothetical protein [Bacteroidota bacterium]
MSIGRPLLRTSYKEDAAIFPTMFQKVAFGIFLLVLFLMPFDLPIISSIIFVGALVALTNTILVLLLGQTRVAFAMARDQLLPKKLAA